MIPTLEDISKITGKHPKLIHGCYLFGSRVYGTASIDSDWDIILIANASSPDVEYKIGDFNIHIVVPNQFKEWVRVNHIKAIECLFAPDWAIIKPFEIDFKFRDDRFRHNISHTVSNSWVKCKKKLAQGDYYIGIKSIFHALRIVSFGIEFAKSRKITFDSMNWLWEELNTKEWTWEELKDKYQPLRNILLTEFRTFVEKQTS